MKSYKKQVLITCMRVFALAFVLIMSLGFINIMSCKETNGQQEYTNEEPDKQVKVIPLTDYIFNMRNRSFTYYSFVFVLGAFWNIKKLIRTGSL